ncbi:hypothetical protein [Streptomyces sp. NPDC005486]|uniref:hypothetical protein n=1 Tax=Streptomyces sp. NPDC005486 TaxID=3155345 RepID=UPI0033A2E61E
MAGDDVTITVRADNGDVIRAFRDTEGRLRDMRGRFVTEGSLMSRSMGQVTDSANGLRGGMMSLAPAVQGVGAAMGLSLLPALGAAVPAVIGLGVAAGTLKLGFSGISDAVALAGEDSKKYNETLKKMSPAQRDFTKALVAAKGEFSGIGKEIQKAMLPGFTRAVQSAGPVVKILGKSMTELGDAFGDAADGVGRMLKDSGFQHDLQANLKLGTGFVKDMTSAMGPFSKSMLDFGAASGPTLKSLSDGIGGLLSQGLPGMFTGLQAGIPGTAKMLDGLFSAVDDILPALGRLSGELGKTLGPAFGEAFRVGGKEVSGAFDTIRGAMVLLRPVFEDITYGFKTILDVGKIVGPTFADVGAALVSAFLPVGQSIEQAEGPLQRLNTAVANNKGAIQEYARLTGDAFLTLAQAGTASLPLLMDGFKFLASTALTAFDVVISGAAHAFSWVPGLGDKLEAANASFDSFASQVRSSLSAASDAASSFAASAKPKLEAGRLKLDINNWTSQIETARAKLKTVPESKKADLRANIADLEAKVRAARGQLASLHDKTVTLTSIHNVITNSKTYRSVHDITGKANGGLMPRYASGGDVQFAPNGLLSGPGTGTSDDILALFASGAVGAVSDTEFVVNAKETKKHLPLLEAINDGRLPKFAMGGMTKGQLKGLSAPSDVAGLSSTLGEVRARIKERTSGGTESRMLRALDAVGKKLLVQEKALTGVNKALDGAKSKLTDLKSASAQMATSVKSGILSSANITRGVTGDKLTTVSSIMGGLTASRDKASAFSGALAGLRSKGLSASLIQQIAESGIEGGGLETAGALMSASSSEIGSINSLQGQINASATSAGKTTADAMYATAIKNQTSATAKLQHSQDKLERTMAALAKALNKKLGGKAAGGIVGAAASGGIRSNLTWVGEQGPELLDLPAGARVWSSSDSQRKASAPWASMLNTPRRASAPAAAPAAGGGGGAQEVRVVLEIRAGDRGQHTTYLVEQLRDAVRAQGSIEAVLRPPRGR